MPKGICPGCGDGIQVFRDAELGDSISCPKCGASLQIIGTHPLKLDTIPEAAGGVKEKHDLEERYDVKPGESYLEEYYAERARASLKPKWSRDPYGHY